jgi:hypothetical protein
MTRYDDDDDDNFEIVTDSRGRKVKIVREGERVRVPMFMMDGSPNPALSPLQRAVAEDKATRAFDLTDTLAMYKPGFRDHDAAALDALEAAYRAYDTADAQAWRCGTNYDASGEFIDEQEGAVCVVSGSEYPLDQGSPGQLRKVGGRLVCIPDQRRDAQTDARAQAYADYDRQMADAWRNPR